MLLGVVGRVARRLETSSESDCQNSGSLRVATTGSGTMGFGITSLLGVVSMVSRNERGWRSLPWPPKKRGWLWTLCALAKGRAGRVLPFDVRVTTCGKTWGVCFPTYFIYHCSVMDDHRRCHSCWNLVLPRSARTCGAAKAQLHRLLPDADGSPYVFFYLYNASQVCCKLVMSLTCDITSCLL